VVREDVPDRAPAEQQDETGGFAVMLEKPLGRAGKVAGRALGPPINLGLTVIGRTIGLARGTARSVSRVVPGLRSDRPDDARPWPPAPSPADLADIADRADRAVGREAAAEPGEPGGPPTEEAEEVITPVGTPGADVAHNPDTTDTDLQQPGTEPLMDPATTKAVASEAETLHNAADPDKG
jgi:hypothetical protein